MTKPIFWTTLVAAVATASLANAQPTPPTPEPAPPQPTDMPAPPEPAQPAPPAPPPAPNPLADPGGPIAPDAAKPEIDHPPGDPSLAALGVSSDGGGAKRFVIYRNEELGAYLKPIIWIAGAVVSYSPSNTGNPELQRRLSTLAMSRFGFEGALNKYTEFGLQFERDLGFSVSGGGPVGTGVWEGTASLQARESYIRLKRYGVELSAGIVVDPASVDFMPLEVFDLFGMDPFVRDPLLFSGFNMSQGVLLRIHDPILYKLGMPGKLALGMHFTSGNPLVTSLSYGFGGNVSSNGTLFTSPLRAISNGFPGSNIQVETYSPSLTYEVEIADKIGFDLRGGLQFYKVDIDVTSTDDVHVNGYNARASARLRLPYVALMGSYAHRTNDQLPIPDLTTLSDDTYKSNVWSLGLDANYQQIGLGASIASIHQEFSAATENIARYVNIAASYTLDPGFLAVGVRYSDLWNSPRGVTTQPTDAKALMLTMHLTI